MYVHESVYTCVQISCKFPVKGKELPVHVSKLTASESVYVYMYKLFSDGINLVIRSNLPQGRLCRVFMATLSTTRSETQM